MTVFNNFFNLKTKIYQSFEIDKFQSHIKVEILKTFLTYFKH